MGALIFLKNMIKLFFLKFLIQGYYMKNLTSSRYVIKLDNYENIQYTGNIYLGSNNQKLDVIFSTGSPLNWVTGVNCKNCRNNTNKYNKN